MTLTLKHSLLALIPVLILAAFLRLHKLDNQSFIADEYLGADIAQGYHQTGQWKLWDFNNEKLTDETYTRAQVYYWQVAQVLKFFPLNEQSGRLISVGWGMLGIILIYLVAYLWFKNPTISLISALLMAVSVSALMFDRKLRMYSMFSPVYFLLSFWVYQFLETAPKRGSQLINKISIKINLNLNYLPLVLIFLALAFATHLLTVNIFPATAVFLIVMAIYKYKTEKNWKNKYTFFSILALISFVGIYQVPEFRSSINWQAFNWTYLQKVTLDYSYILLGLIFLIIGAGNLIKKDFSKGVWILTSFLVPLLLAIFVWKRNAGHQYIYFTLPFKIILVASGIYYSAKYVWGNLESSKKTITSAMLTLAVLVLVMINFPFFFSSEGFYQSPLSWSYPNYKQAFGYYLKNKQDNDLLITRQLTSYYIRASHSQTLIYNEENRLSLDAIKQAQEKYSRIWYIASTDEPFIRGDAREYIEKNFELKNTKYTNHEIEIWMWEKEGSVNSK